MHLMYYYKTENGKRRRVYSLKKELDDGTVTVSAHPGARVNLWQRPIPLSACLMGTLLVCLVTSSLYGAFECLPPR